MEAEVHADDGCHRDHKAIWEREPGSPSEQMISSCPCTVLQMMDPEASSTAGLTSIGALAARLHAISSLRACPAAGVICSLCCLRNGHR